MTSLRPEDVRIDQIVESSCTCFGVDEFFPGLDPAAVAGDMSATGPEGETAHLEYAFRSHLVRDGQRTILVDGCVGNGKHRMRPAFDDLATPWLDRLHATGVRPEDVDYVVITHLHADHVGWATTLVDGRWVPTFPNARYLLHRDELEYWYSDVGAAALLRTGDYLADSVTPLLDHGLVDRFDSEFTLGDAVRIIPMIGHTPGHTCVEVTAGDERLFLAGDAFHHPIQIRRPELGTRYCVDPAQAAESRRRILAYVSETGALLAPAHFVGTGTGRVHAVGDGYRFTPVTTAPAAPGRV
ncbi:MBL fold metallo-hydrolase [Rhodococcus rhodnii]|uniref:Metallo-beta-lactamase domain-containing protein n=2 Tax=Rhodococcus rhodnii TaxID=38312 RepID=R7WJN9_9NOCA|nr:MBL fold metallo-hydrolase [Rhodococcus rhodnii]EOM75517.1 hypothetical protein Rrhod_3315 [Rhodococcus rhodnii LMG 5362]TXG90476.1 MBL fold metallo-hydrolase [Rhodococcus rhodnii]